MIQIFTLHLAANEAREVALSGEYFEIRNAISPLVLVELLDRSGGVISGLQNPEQSDFVKPGHFETVRVTNGGVAQTCKFFVGSGDAGSRRTSGKVQVEGIVQVSGITGANAALPIIEKEKEAAVNKVLYSASLYVASSAENRSLSQIYNPVGSGKLISVTRMAVNPATAANFSVVGSDVELATLVVNSSCNHYIGEAMGIAKGKTGYLPGNPAYSGLLWSAFASANSEAKWDITGEVIIPPGKSILCFSAIANVSMVMNVSWYEKDIPAEE